GLDPGGRRGGRGSRRVPRPPARPRGGARGVGRAGDGGPRQRGEAAGRAGLGVHRPHDGARRLHRLRPARLGVEAPGLGTPRGCRSDSPALHGARAARGDDRGEPRGVPGRSRLMDLETLLARVLSLGEDEDWASAADLLAEPLEEFDDEAAVHCWLGVAERELGMEGVAYERFKRTLALGPTDPYVLATAGNAVAAFDDPEAEQALRTAALTAPDVPLTRLLYGAYLTREGLFEEAGGELLAARALDEDDPQIRYELGVLYALQERYDEAADTLADAVRLDPEDAWTRAVFGLVLLETDRPEEAAGELVEAARLDEQDVEAQLLASL